MVNIILDTDLETDCDDVGALCVLHTLAQRGTVRILGIVASVNSPRPAAAVAAINAALGRSDIPVGENRTVPNSPAYIEHVRNTQDRLCCRAVAEPFHAGRIEDAVELYFRLLEQAEDFSVTICAIGMMTVLAEVMRRPKGMDLIRSKVVRMVSMADGLAPEGYSGFNWNMDPEATQTVIADWPTELMISPVGTDVLTGVGLTALASDNPLRKAYEIWGGKTGFLRPSWDQLAVLAASGVAFQEEYIRIIRRGNIVYDTSTGNHHWTEDKCGRHCCIDLCRQPALTARWVEQFMLDAWK